MSRIPGIANFDRAAAPLMSTLMMAMGRRELRDCAMGQFVSTFSHLVGYHLASTKASMTLTGLSCPM